MDRIKYLLLLVLREEASPAEQAELERWLAESPANRELMQDLQDAGKLAAALALLDRLHRQEAWAKVESHAATHSSAPVVTLADARRNGRRILLRWSAAAAVTIIMGTGVWWFIQTRQTTAPVAQITKAPDIAAPARNRATLTLSSGKRVDLDSAASGALATQGGAQVIKSAGGQLAYQVKLQHPGELLYNTLTNPRGSQVVTLTLSDGTKIWLNAESSIRYPAVFIGSDRTVEVTGEAYFEVKKKADQPFKVELKDGTKMEVLGTTFNVNAYDDENAIKTTLLEGSVRVRATTSDSLVGVNANANKLSVVLKPGQQAQVVGLKTMSVLNNVDTAAVMAWKNGRFAFDDADLPTVMRQLARWYDIEVTYDGNIPKREFNGKIGKTLTLDQLLKVLITTTRFHYTIEANKLTIRP